MTKFLRSKIRMWHYSLQLSRRNNGFKLFSNIYKQYIHTNDIKNQKIIRKRLESFMSSSYNPEEIEKDWQIHWELLSKSNDTKNNNNKTFSMLLPPPNITGVLHLGHALTITIQDTLIRWYRMKGYTVKWIPGLDHAGIATQSIVERKLLKEEGKSRNDLGKEKFLYSIWEWHEKHGNEIFKQLKKLGALLNWEDEYFTLDKKRSNTVTDAFIKLFNKNLIYRERKMINWCPILKTAIADIEINNISIQKSTWMNFPNQKKSIEVGVIHKIKYEVYDMNRQSNPEYLLVYTTRPETILGDVALAIHPDDRRYFKYHNKYVIHPFKKNLLPIVLDEKLVKMDFGSGVVKVTPAHDNNDYLCGKRHELAEVTVIDKNGQISCSDYQKYNGMNRFEARKVIIDDLDQMNLYLGKSDHATTISLCSRSGDLIEPMLQPQWFLNCSSMAQNLVNKIETGQLKIYPQDRNTKILLNYLNNIQDWCISRQLWWGHQIPAYKVNVLNDNKNSSGNNRNGFWIVAKNENDVLLQVREKYSLQDHEFTIKKDSDVLDTWFSSALLPLSAATSYPLNLMETGSDILFFWVARMAMLCNELNGSMPFLNVFLHPLIRSKSGKKMSKSDGNVINPLDLIESNQLDYKDNSTSDYKNNGLPICGADALRFTLASYLEHERYINMDIQRAISYRHFCNKIWNATKYFLNFSLTNSYKIKSKNWQESINEIRQNKHNMFLPEKWILSRLALTVKECNKAFNAYDFAKSASLLYRFFIYDFCDNYLEFSKIDNKEKTNKCLILATCLEIFFHMLHPLMPFISEELWHRIRGMKYDPNISILNRKYPEDTDIFDFYDDNNERSMKEINGLCRNENIHVGKDTELNPSGTLTYNIMDACTLYLKLSNDFETFDKITKEIKRLEIKKNKTQHSLLNSIKILNNIKDKKDVPERIIKQQDEKKLNDELILKDIHHDLDTLLKLQKELKSL